MTRATAILLLALVPPILGCAEVSEPEPEPIPLLPPLPRSGEARPARGGKLTSPLPGAFAMAAPHYDTHEGWDWKMPPGTEVLAVADGTVLEVREDLAVCEHEVGGWTLVMDDATRPQRRISYGGLSYTAYAPGDPVVRGAVVGLSSERLHLGVHGARSGGYVARDPYGDDLWASGHQPDRWAEQRLDAPLGPCGRVIAVASGVAVGRADAIAVDLRGCSARVELVPNDRAWSYVVPPGERVVIRPDDVHWNAEVQARPGLWSGRDCLHAYVDGFERTAIALFGIGRCGPHATTEDDREMLGRLPVPTALLGSPYERTSGWGRTLAQPADGICVGGIARDLELALAAYPSSVRRRAIGKIWITGAIERRWPGIEKPDTSVGLYIGREILLDAHQHDPWTIHHEIAHALAGAGLLPEDPWPDLLDGFSYTWGLHRRGPVDPEATGDQSARELGFVRAYGASAAAEDLADTAAWLMTGVDHRPRSSLLDAKRERLAGWYRGLGIEVP